MVTSRLVATLHTFHGLTSCLLLLPALSQVVVDARTVISSPKESPGTVLIIGQHRSTDLSLCTGTLIAAHWVLTARSCLYYNATRITQFLVYAGGSSYQEYADRKLPPSAQLLSSYRSFVNTKYDMALLRTQGAFRPSEYVRFVPMMDLPIRNDDDVFKTYYTVCSVTGFGSLDSKANETYRITDKTLKVYSPCPRRSACSFDYYAWQKMKGPYACTWRWYRHKGHDQECAASLGAGLICMGQLHGVAHTTVSEPMDSSNPCILEPVNTDPCSNRYTVSVFTTVYPQRRWIDETIWPERFPHPFPGCYAFGLGVKRDGSSPFMHLLVVYMLLQHLT